MTDETPKLTNTNRGLYAALLLDEKPWSWNWKFNPNLKEHMHALGVIAANYNELEGHFYRLFYLTLNKFEVGKIIFSKFNNAERIETALKLERDDFSSNRHPALCFCWSMIPRVEPEGMLFGKPPHTLR